MCYNDKYNPTNANGITDGINTDTEGINADGITTNGINANKINADGINSNGLMDYSTNIGYTTFNECKNYAANHSYKYFGLQDYNKNGDFKSKCVVSNKTIDELKY